MCLKQVFSTTATVQKYTKEKEMCIVIGKGSQTPPKETCPIDFVLVSI